MKKLILLVISFSFITFFVFKENKKEIMVNRESIEKRAVFISYLEYQSLLVGKPIKTQKLEINKMIENIKNLNLNMIILQVRTFCDSIYPSKIYPFSYIFNNHELKKYDFDYLDYFIKEAKKNNIELLAWVNPFRIRNNTSIDTITEYSPAYKYLNTNHVKVIPNKGIFFNPASIEIQDLIIDGIKEIINNYPVDGILLDDYFYPDNTIDLKNYEESNSNLSISDYRLDNISNLIRRIYKITSKNNLKLAISPEGNINNNYEINYADVKKWVSEEGYLDYIMPQIYFGFLNERKPFLETVKVWNDLIKIKKIELIPAISSYKIGKYDNNALSGKEEWLNNNDILMKQIIVSRNLSNYNGFSLFRYEYLFNLKYYTENTFSEIANLKKIL